MLPEDMEPSLEPRMLAVLRELGNIRRAVAMLEYEVVHLVRESGATWEMVGDALDLSRQAAARKFSTPRGRRI